MKEDGMKSYLDQIVPGFVAHSSWNQCLKFVVQMHYVW